MGLRTFTKRYISICEESRGAEGDEALRCESLFSFFVGGGGIQVCVCWWLLVVVVDVQGLRFAAVLDLKNWSARVL